jgi:hypothetical protein
VSNPCGAFSNTVRKGSVRSVGLTFRFDPIVLLPIVMYDLFLDAILRMC